MKINNQKLILLQSYSFGIILFALMLHLTPFNSFKIQMLYIVLGLICIKLFDYNYMRFNKYLLNQKSLLGALLIFFFGYIILNINKNYIFDFSVINYLYILCIFLCIISFRKTFFSIGFIMFFLSTVIIINFTFYVRLANFSSNTLGIVHYLLTYLIVISILKTNRKLFKIIYFFILLMNIYIILLSNSRTAILCLFLFFMLILIWKYIKKIKYVFGMIVILINILFIHLYLQLFLSEKGHILNQYVINKTGKGFFSGRNIIWDEAIDIYIDGRSILFGQGNNFKLETFNVYNNYLHNIYIQSIYQYGLIGFCFIVVIFLFILKIFTRTSKLTKVSYAFFLSLIVMQTFEGFLLTTTSSATYIGWLILALMINFVLEENKKCLN